MAKAKSYILGDGAYLGGEEEEEEDAPHAVEANAEEAKAERKDIVERPSLYLYLNYFNC